MSYDDFKAAAALTGLMIFIALFAGVLIYAFWPGNKRRFERASRIPLETGEPDEGKHGR